MIRKAIRWYCDAATRRSAWLPDLGTEINGHAAPRCLISYVTDFVRHVVRLPEFQDVGWKSPQWDRFSQRVANGFSHHTLYWESLEMVRQFILRGYVVDMVDDRRASIVPHHPTRYDIIVDEWTNLPAWKEGNPDARTLFYSTGAHWLALNRAELERLAWLRNRTGCEVTPIRQVPALLGAGSADLITSFGNTAINETFGKDLSKIRNLNISATLVDVPLCQNGLNETRRRFLWFGGTGWVHKGLDIALEAFLRMPDLELVVCGFSPHHDVRKQKEIIHCYGEAISKSHNIKLYGYIDPVSAKFKEICDSCGSFVYPTACEGCSGAAVQCLHMGLIPITTDLCGLNEDVQAIIIAGQSDEELIDSTIRACRRISELPPAELEERRRAVWQFANAHHTRFAYRESLSTVIDELVHVGR